jgi:hypothetical protein
MKTMKICFDGTLECGALIQNAVVEVPEDYTMRNMVEAVKEAGYSSFKLPSMKKFVSIEK